MTAYWTTGHGWCVRHVRVSRRVGKRYCLPLKDSLIGPDGQMNPWSLSV